MVIRIWGYSCTTILVRLTLVIGRGLVSWGLKLPDRSFQSKSSFAAWIQNKSSARFAYRKQWLDGIAIGRIANAHLTSSVIITTHARLACAIGHRSITPVGGRKHNTNCSIQPCYTLNSPPVGRHPTDLLRQSIVKTCVYSLLRIEIHSEHCLQSDFLHFRFRRMESDSLEFLSTALNIGIACIRYLYFSQNGFSIELSLLFWHARSKFGSSSGPAETLAIFL